MFASLFRPALIAAATDTEGLAMVLATWFDADFSDDDDSFVISEIFGGIDISDLPSETIAALV